MHFYSCISFSKDLFFSVFGPPVEVKFEFQMRILNLAKEPKPSANAPGVSGSIHW